MIGIDSLPASWKLVKCQDVIDVRDGTHDTPVKMPDGIPLITSKNLKDEGIDFSDVTYISEEAHREIEKRSRVDDRDIIFAMIGTIGNPVIVTKDRPFSIKNIALFKLGSSAVYPEYFKHLLSTNFITRQLDSSTRGGSQKFVSLQVLRNLIIPLPPIDRQKRIAAILDKAEELRRLRRQSIVKLEDLSRSTFLEMFGDPLKNPKAWKTLKLEDVVSRITDGEHQTPKRTLEGIKLLSARNIQDGYIDVKNVDYIGTEEYERIRKRCDPVRGDILISCSGTIGRVTLVKNDEPFSLVRSVALIKPIVDLVNPKFLECFLRTTTLRRKMQQRANASSQANLFQNQIKVLPAFLPPLSLQQEFAQRIEAIESLKAQHCESLTHLDTLFASLQHRAFRGEL